MNLPLMPTGGGVPAISSLEIAEITKKEHSHVMRDIRKILDEAQIDQSRFGSVFKDSYGRSQNCYILPRRESDLVVSGYSVKYRLAIIDRWQELEAKEAFHIPQTLSEALRLSADLADKVMEQQAALETVAPKVEFYDTCMESSDVCQLAVVAQVAKLPYGRNTLFQKLRESGVLITGGDRHNMPYQEFINRGLFTVNQRTIENPKTGEPIIIHTSYATQKGLAWIISKYGKPNGIEGGAQ